MSAPHLADVAHAAAGVDWSSTTVWVALGLFIATYALILTERINRAVLAVLGAGLMILFGVLSQEQAIAGIDFNTIGLLLGMMMIVAIAKESGVFQFIAIWSAQLVKGNPLGLLAVMAIVTAVFSALLDNVTTVLLTTPVILLLTRELEVKPYPYLFTSILASNLGGAATLIGDPPNIMIGSASHLTFNDFLVHMAPVAFISLAVTMVIILWFWRNSLFTTEQAKNRIMKMNATAAITDKSLLIKSLVVLGGVLFGFTVGHTIFHLPPATIAMTGAVILLLWETFQHDSEKQHEKVHHTIAEAEWVTLFFFGGLFILVHGLEKVGLINWLADHLIHATGGDLAMTATAILWGSAILSALVDNIPFVATMIPLLHAMTPEFGGEIAMEPLWWALAMGACFGGNGSLIGASANLVVAGLAERNGQKISFVKFMLGAFPLMLVSIVISTVYLWVRYL